MKHNLSSVFKNITVSPLSEKEIEFLRIWRNNADNTKFLRKIPYITSEMQEEWFAKYLDNQDEICFSVFENNLLNRCVGSASLYNFAGDSAEFGQILIGDPEAHGKNVGYHTVIAVLSIGFEELQLKKIILHVYSANKGALHIYEKAGFTVTDIHLNDNMEEYTMTVDRERFNKLKEEYLYAGR